MFILVSMLFGFVTGGHSGSPWRAFEFWSRLTKSLLVQCTLCSTKKIKDSKKLLHVDLPFFIRKVVMIANLGIGGLQ